MSTLALNGPNIPGLQLSFQRLSGVPRDYFIEKLYLERRHGNLVLTFVTRPGCTRCVKRCMIFFRCVEQFQSLLFPFACEGGHLL